LQSDAAPVVKSPALAAPGAMRAKAVPAVAKRMPNFFVPIPYLTSSSQ
jgi:hypothetical protein